MRNAILLVALAGATFLGGLAVSGAQTKEGPEKQTIAAARKQYDLEIDKAKKVYREAIERAQHRLLDVYDEAIISVIKNGGGDGLEVANALSAEKKKVKNLLADSVAPAVPSTDKGVGAGASRDEFVKNLTSKTWFFHWEKRERDYPCRYSPDGMVAIGVGPKAKVVKWSLEQKWVLYQDGNYLMPLDDHTMRGFFVGTGRQVGAFADPPQDVPGKTDRIKRPPIRKID